MNTNLEILQNILRKRILILDGSMGVFIQRFKLSEEQFRGEKFKSHPVDLKGNNDILVLTQPEIIKGIHRNYLEAGSDIIETNTFNGTAISQADYKTEHMVYEINFEAAKIAVKEMDESIGAILQSALPNNAVLIITADHGNAESLVYRGTGEAETRHDDNPVPFYLVGRQFQVDKTPEQIAQETSEISGILADIAPTILELMGIPQPEEMTGKSLLPLLILTI